MLTTSSETTARPEVETEFVLANRLSLFGRTSYLPIREAEQLFSNGSYIAACGDLLRRRPELLTAIRIASPSLANAVLSWLDGHSFKNRKGALKLLMYLLRSATRTTPFGMFSGVGEVPFGDRATLQISPNGWRTVTRPDMGWALAVIESLSSDEDAFKRMRLYSSDMFIRRGERVHVFNPKTVSRDPHRIPEYARISLRETDGVRFILDQCSSPLSVSELTDRCAKHFDADHERALQFIKQLYDAGLLLPDFRPSPIGRPVEQVRNSLAAISEQHLEQFDYLLSEAHRFDAIPSFAKEQPTLKRLEDLCAQLGKPPNMDVALQVDMQATFDGTLPASLESDICMLAQLHLRTSPPSTALSDLVERFRRRYEGYERLVPLLELASPDFGIGGTLVQSAPSAQDERYNKLALLASSAIAARSDEIMLSEDLLDKILLPAPANGRVPNAFQIAFELFAGDKESIESGNYRISASALIGTNGAYRTVGRFAYLLSDEFRANIREAAIREADLDVPTELVYQSAWARGINVSTRPRVVDAELCLGVRSDATVALSPQDVLVGVRDGRFFLWSKSLSRVLCLRERHVLNTTQSAPSLIRFLSAIANDGYLSPSPLDWGPANSLPCLPRLRYGRIVLSRRRWLLDRQALEESSDKRTWLDEWRALWGVPDDVFLVSGDNKLFIRLSHEVAADLLLQGSRDHRSSMLFIQEAPPATETAWFGSSAGAHRLELVATIEKTNRAVTSRAVPSTIVISNGERVRTPASDWIYLRLFVAEPEFERALSFLRPMIQEAVAGGAIKWFFLRYSEPRSHIRLRIQVDRKCRSATLDLLTDFVEDAVRNEIIEEYEYATYQRECERYGGTLAMDVVEGIFHRNSEEIINALARISEPDSQKKLHATIVLAHPLLRSLLGEEGTNGWLERYGVRKRKLPPSDWEAIRRLRKEFVGLEGGDVYDSHAKALRALKSESALFGDYLEISSSILHMHFNRCGIGMHEDYARTLLNTTYSSLFAQSRT